MRCLKIVTLLCLSASLSILSAMEDLKDPRSSSALLPTISATWNQKRNIYFQIGGECLVDEFDTRLKALLIEKKEIEIIQNSPKWQLAYPNELSEIKQKILEQLKQFSTSRIIHIFTARLSFDRSKDFISRVEDLNDEFDTNSNYIEELHALYLKYFSH
jgi:predicted metal-dependent enzyme (double-stranded beta helix superfamily)